VSRIIHQLPNSLRASGLLITFVLEPHADEWNVGRHAGLADLTDNLVRLMAGYRMPATWAVGDPAYSAATSSILSSGVEHEMAVLGDRSWLGRTAGRPRFARELARRVHHARHLGIPISSLIPRGAKVDDHFDLLVKNGVTAIGGMSPDERRPMSPRALRFGLWEWPRTSCLPMQSRWFSGARTLARRIRKSVSAGDWFHLLVDLPAISQESATAERTVVRLLRRVAVLRDRGDISVVTLNQATAQLCKVPASTPQRSILRSAG
jgi:hypothetical protein